ncbi:MAG: tetratricopeptide repeat protein [Alphaproteobacteria bacterium]
MPKNPFAVLAVIAKQDGKLREAETAYRRALPLLEQPDHHRATVLGNLANLLTIRGEFDDAERHYQRMLTISESETYTLGRAIGHIGLGDIAQARGHLTDAEESYKKAVKLLERLEGEVRRIAVISALGMNAARRGDFQTAETRLRKALALAREKEASGLEGVVLNGLGEMYRMRGNLAEAEKFHRSAEGIFRQEKKDRGGKAGVLAGLGKVALERDQFVESAELLRRALRICDEIGIENDTAAKFELWRGEALAGQGKTASACTAFVRARNLYRRAGNDGKIRTVERFMAEANCPGS